MTTPKQTLEYLAARAFPESEERALRCLAALREAADMPPSDPKVLVEWYRNDASFHNLVDLLASQRLEGARDAVRQEERGAIRELAHNARTVIHRDFLIAWLDARSRGEEPKP